MKTYETFSNPIRVLGINVTNDEVIFLAFNHRNKMKLKLGIWYTTRFENRVQFQGSRREKILESTKLGQMECTEVLRPRDGLPEHFGI